jgi:hypothetical protein
MKKLIFLVLCVAAMAAEPITKAGKGCPVGYRVSGAYCIPNANAKHTILKTGNGCPVGYRDVYGKYCVKN